LPASLESSRRLKTGLSSTPMTTSDAIASGQGRACTISLHCRQRDRPATASTGTAPLPSGTSGTRAAAGSPDRRRPNVRRPPGARRTMRAPKRESSAGSTVSEARRVSSTASTEAIASP
jgi:hypothetical protein